MNWKINTTFDEGLEKTIQWYLSNRNWWKTIVKNSLNQTPWKN